MLGDRKAGLLRLLSGAGCIYLGLSAVASTYTFSATIDIRRGLGRDHAELERDQAIELQKFLKEYFLDWEGNISLRKVKAFEDILKGKKSNLTEVLEKSVEFEQILADVRRLQKSRRFAQEHRMNVNRTLEMYDTYIIPTIEMLRRSLEEGKPKEQSQAYLDDFIRGYHLIRAVGAHVTPWKRNTDVPKIIEHTFKPWTFKKDVPKNYEAINLLVENQNLPELKRCLGVQLKTEYYLTKKDIQNLIKCGYDISKLNPGVSAFWTESTPESRKEYIQFTDRASHFPTADMPIYFNEVMLTSAASPKIQVKVDFGNKLIRKYKLKWGHEVHTDPAASYLGRLLGFNTDTIKYYPKIRFYLGKVSYEKFEAALQAKWGTNTVDYTLFAYGTDPRLGNYVEIQDAMLEARPEDFELRVGAFDPTLMDFQDRREFRGSMLFHAWINLEDLKAANMKLLISRNESTAEDSRPRILLRIKDMGYSFGQSMFWMKPWQIDHITMFASNYLPNEFERKGIVTLKEPEKPDQTDKVSIRWNDIQMITGIFKNVTYYDLKWMARKIAALTPEEIEWTMISGGAPREIARLYRHVLVKRRNEMVKAFRLNEDGVSEYPTPDLKKWNPQDEGIPSEPVNADDQIPAIKKGEVIKTHFKGKQVYLRNRNTLAYYSVQILSSVIGKVIDQVKGTDQKFSFSDKTDVKISGSPATAGVNSSFSAKHQMISEPIKASLSGGLSASITRSVRMSPSTFHNDLDNAGRPYIIHDVLTLSFGAGTPLAKQLGKFLPVTVNLSAKMFHAQFDYYHYHETFAGSYITSPLPFLETLVNPDGYSVEKLNRMEVIRRSLSYGLQVSGSAQAFDFDPVIVNRVGIGAGAAQIYDEAFFVDQFGDLHYYTQDTNGKSASLDMIILELLKLRTPFVNFQNTKQTWETTQRDSQTMSEGLKTRERPINRDPKYMEEVRQDLSQLRDASKTGEPPRLENSRLETVFQLESKGKSQFRHWNILGHGHMLQKIRSSTEMVGSSGKKESITFSQRQTNKYVGMSSLDNHIPFRDLTLKNSQRVRLNIEIDNYDPINKFGIQLKVMEFRRYQNREEVDRLIQDVNKKFSKDLGHPFYSGKFEIPDAKEVNEFRKVYVISHVILNGTDFLEKLMMLDRDELKSRVKRYRGSSGELPEDYDRLKESYRKLGNLRVLQASGERDDPKSLKKAYLEISRGLEKFFSHLEVNTYGIGFLKELVGQDSILVMGAIEGIMPSFSTLQNLQERQQCRYIADGGWGNWNGLLPVLYLNRYNRYAYKSVLLGNHVSLDQIFGVLETTLPEELKPATAF